MTSGLLASATPRAGTRIGRGRDAEPIASAVDAPLLALGIGRDAGIVNRGHLERANRVARAEQDNRQENHLRHSTSISQVSMEVKAA